LQKTLKIFIQNLEDNRFTDAHEVMEAQWKIYKKANHPLTKLLKGYINGATAFEIIKRGNVSGANRLWTVYEKYLPLLQNDTENYPLFLEADELLRKLKKDRL